MDNVVGITKKYSVGDFWISSKGQDGRYFSRLLVPSEQTQSILDSLQGALGKNLRWKISIITADAVLPKISDEKNEEESKNSSISTTREALYNSIEKNAQLDISFLRSSYCIFT